MRNETRKLYNAYLGRIGELNGVDDVTVTFSVEPTIAQTLETKIQESSEFLTRINIYPVGELEGALVGINSSGPIASRTNVNANDRTTRDPTGLEDRKYRCEDTDYNTHLTWAKLDQWAKFPDFQTKVRDVVVRQQGLDRIMIGFNGTHVSVQSDLAMHPKLQDINCGWLHTIRLEAPERVMGSAVTVQPANKTQPGTVVAEPIEVGATGAYKNLDALAYDMAQLLDPWFQERTDLVMICGRKILHDKYFPIINRDQAPSEMLATDIITSQKTIGGYPAVRVPFFPDNAMLLTTLENLSIYVQEQSRRRKIEENAKRKRVEDYQSSNDDYVVEEYGLVALAENIEFVEAEEA
ncbi:MAG: phage major capsid protein, P2 family [Pseudomonadota bacterium]